MRLKKAPLRQDSSPSREISHSPKRARTLSPRRLRHLVVWTYSSAMRVFANLRISWSTSDSFQQSAIREEADPYSQTRALPLQPHRFHQPIRRLLRHASRSPPNGSRPVPARRINHRHKLYLSARRRRRTDTLHSHQSRCPKSDAVMCRRAG